MANLQKRGRYVPRAQRERKAFRLVLFGGGTGVAGVVTLILLIVGAMSSVIPTIVLLGLAALSVRRFRRVTGQR